MGCKTLYFLDEFMAVNLEIVRRRRIRLWRKNFDQLLGVELAVVTREEFSLKYCTVFK